jgi:putative two-component system response regulator
VYSPRKRSIRVEFATVDVQPRAINVSQLTDGGNMQIQEMRPIVLLIDDCEPHRSMYEMTLEAAFDVVSAARGREGLRLAATNRPNVILLDVLMPGMDGWETCTRLKSDPATESIPVILLTGATDLDLTDHAMAVGASDVLTKPCSPSLLLETIQRALGRNQSMNASV